MATKYEFDDIGIPKKKSKDALEGYGSDSENNDSDSDEEQLNTGDEDTGKTTKDNDDEDDDMFASDTEKEPETKKPPKKLDMDQFEKEQGIGSYDEERVEIESVEGGDDLDEDEKLQQQRYYSNIELLEEGGLRSRPQADIAIEGFNLRKEKEEGDFDQNLNYVANKADEEEDEAWLQDVRKADIIKARKAQLRSQEKSSKKIQRPTDTLLSIIIDLLEPAETTFEALSRLNPRKLKRASKKKENESTEEIAERKRIIGDLTSACDEMMTDKAVEHIYEMSREELMRLYKVETGEQFMSSRGLKRSAEEMEVTLRDDQDKVWEFRWLGEEEVQGPFSTYEMLYWKGNYFNSGVEARKAGEAEFKHIDTIDFD